MFVPQNTPLFHPAIAYLLYVDTKMEHRPLPAMDCAKDQFPVPISLNRTFKRTTRKTALRCRYQRLDLCVYLLKRDAIQGDNVLAMNAKQERVIKDI